MRTIVVPCLADNYAYLITQDDKTAICVDPSESAPILHSLGQHGLRLAAILNTHHHHDHVGGNADLVARFPDVEVVAHRSDVGRVPCQTRGVTDQETFRAGGQELTALHIPGHTKGAVAYLLNGAVFTGDTLFVAGCGRLFEGTANDMQRSLNETLGSLDGDTKVYCGHEYTVANLKFALTVEPDNPELRMALVRAEELRHAQLPTVPSTMVHERRTNPFLRVHLHAYKNRFGSDYPADVLAALRKQKDTFVAR